MWRRLHTLREALQDSERSGRLYLNAGMAAAASAVALWATAQWEMHQRQALMQELDAMTKAQVEKRKDSWRDEFMGRSETTSSDGPVLWAGTVTRTMGGLDGPASGPNETHTHAHETHAAPIVEGRPHTCRP